MYLLKYQKHVFPLSRTRGEEKTVRPSCRNSVTTGDCGGSSVSLKSSLASFNKLYKTVQSLTTESLNEIQPNGTGNLKGNKLIKYVQGLMVITMKNWKHFKGLTIQENYEMSTPRTVQLLTRNIWIPLILYIHMFLFLYIRIFLKSRKN